MNIYNKIFILIFLFKNLNCFYIGTNKFNPKDLSLNSKKIKHISSNNILYTPKNYKQFKYVEYLDDASCKIIVSLGPAGTGKTLFACQKAIIQLKTEEINKIIITRPIVTVEEELGFLPGNIIKKMDPWTKPLFDIFLEYYSKTELDLMLNNGKIEICPLAFMRGRTFKNAFIIADEMQNSSPNQMKMLVTRLGDNSRMVITGDLKQTDIKQENGLQDFILKLNNYQFKNNKSNLINTIYFDNCDIERSEIVKKVLEIYNYVKPIAENKIIEASVTINNTNNNDAALIPKHYITHNL